MQAGGLMLFLRVQQYAVKMKMAQMIESEEASFEYLALSLDEFEKCRIDRKEILYRGNMYDIKSKEIIGDSIHLTVINDIREKEVIARIKSLAAQNNPQTRDLPARVIKLFTITFLVPEPFTQENFRDASENIFPCRSGDYHSVPPEILSPPPELA